MQLITPPPPVKCPAVILAGGQGRRMGGADKGLLMLGEAPVLDHVLRRLRPQAGPLALSANGDPARFTRFGLPVLADSMTEAAGGLMGPLAGVLTAMRWAAGQGAARVLTVAADTPFLPADLASRLADADPSRPALSQSASGRHPTAALWPVALADELEKALVNGTRRLGLWAQERGGAWVLFDGHDPDPFFNINTPEDLTRAQVWATG